MPPKKTRPKTPLAALSTLDTITEKLAAIARMKIRELRALYNELHERPTHSRNAVYLRNELGRKVQELSEGGLTERAEMRVGELGDELPERWRRRLTRQQARFVEDATARDPRLPKAGTVLERAYRGKLYQVTVRQTDFEFEGATYPTLSRVARAITGSNWNGFEFFKLDKGGES